MPVRLYFVASLVAAWSAVAVAGPLDPPPGPIAPTQKPLAEIEPRTAINATNTPGDADSVYRIASPGSYYLTASFTAPAGKSAIEIATSNVTIDLGGFTITSLATLDAIQLSSGGRYNIVIRNGSIGTCLGGGIDILPDIVGAVPTVGGSVENVSIHNTSGYGLRTGNGAKLINVHASSCGGNSGIDANEYCTLTSCSANGNAVHGITAAKGSTLVSCTAADNQGSGIETGFGSSVLNCSARTNGDYGFLCGQGASVVNCTARENGDMGIYVTGRSTVVGCTATLNVRFGIYCEFFSSSVSDSNAYDNGDDGITVGSYSTVTGCVASNNGGNGIIVGTGSEVVGCSAGANVRDGIRCGSQALVRDSTCTNNGFGSGNTAAGIHATGDRNRIEGNHCTANDFGIDIDGQANVIIRNTCSDNTQNFVITPDNIYGAIVDRRTPGTPAVVGSAAAGTMGSNDPNANFAH